MYLILTEEKAKEKLKAEVDKGIAYREGRKNGFRWGVGIGWDHAYNGLARDYQNHIDFYINV